MTTVLEKPQNLLAKNKQTNQIYFTRHAQSVANEKGILAGSQDVELTELGRRQSYELAASILRNDFRLDTIISSSMKRARETAEIIAEVVGFDKRDIVLLSSLKERNCGSFEGRLLEEYYQASDQDVITAGGESFQRFYNRAKDAISQIESSSNGQTLVVGHSETYRVFQMIFQNLNFNEYYKIKKPENGKLIDFYSGL